MTVVNGTRPLPVLPQTRDAQVDVETLAPWIQKYSAQYGANPQLVAAVVAQESSFINHGVHRDGTGHGLIGLDDNGLLPDFEAWADVDVGRGRRAQTIAPETQIEFLAMKLAQLTEKFDGDEYEAVRAWHAGVGGRNRRNGVAYEALIRGRISEIAAAVPPFVAGGAMLASNFEPAVPKPVDLRPADGSTHVARGIDYENG